MKFENDTPKGMHFRGKVKVFDDISVISGQTGQEIQVSHLHSKIKV